MEEPLGCVKCCGGMRALGVGVFDKLGPCVPKVKYYKKCPDCGRELHVPEGEEVIDGNV